MNREVSMYTSSEEVSTRQHRAVWREVSRRVPVDRRQAEWTSWQVTFKEEDQSVPTSSDPWEERRANRLSTAAEGSRRSEEAWELRRLPCPLGEGLRGPSSSVSTRHCGKPPTASLSSLLGSSTTRCTTGYATPAVRRAVHHRWAKNRAASRAGWPITATATDTSSAVGLEDQNCSALSPLLGDDGRLGELTLSTPLLSTNDTSSGVSGTGRWRAPSCLLGA
mmetsp:Transcript_71057/g.162944  ORF Transcript_71057/g.162944 Transcript_71057/m.162944 type:complete len:222 (-) Transcript_71057:409-1074(-)